MVLLVVRGFSRIDACRPRGAQPLQPLSLYPVCVMARGLLVCVTARGLFAVLALMLPVRAPANWGLTPARWEKGPPQQYTLWAGGETMAQALQPAALSVALPCKVDSAAAPGAAGHPFGRAPARRGGRA